jgi:4-diphosphocytidyl-2C-methyl-D-erythritol kinase
MILPAYAKLNLTLDVTGRRPNGYHDIDSVMQTISLHDLMWIERTDCRVFEVVGPAIAGENLVLKAARELEGHTSRALPFTIRLFKRIPMGGGLGGGSADAAAFLKAANRLYDLKLTAAELIEIAAAVGQDVPFLLSGGTARATGLGSTVAPLPAAPSDWRFLVVCPPLEISTRAVYEAVDGNAASGRHTPPLVAALVNPPPRPSPTRGEGESRPAPARGERESRPAPARGERESRPAPARAEGEFAFGNDLEVASRTLFPALGEAIDRLRRAVPGLTMSGTGAALFALFLRRQDADAALAAVRELGYPAWVCRPVAAAA